MEFEPQKEIQLAVALREYQDRAITELAHNWAMGHKQQMIALGTGAGKTVIAAGILARIWRSGRVLPVGTRPYFIVERITLARQAEETFRASGMRVSVLQGENTHIVPNADVVVASIQTLRSKHGETKDADGKKIIRELPRDLGMAIIDEAHLLHAMHIELMDRLDATMFVGLSATPLRPGLGEYYSALVKGPTNRELIDAGYLVPSRCFGPSEADLSNVRKGNTTNGIDFVESELADAMATITGDIVSHWQQLGEDRPTLCFCVNVAHAEEVAQAFRLANVDAAAVHYKLTDDEQSDLKAGFVNGQVKVLCAVMTIATGFDAPLASCLILARPTMSETLHMQQCGRGTRLHPDKSDCIIIDHAGNLRSFGRPDEFEVYDLDPEALKRREKKRKQRDADEMVPCLSEGCGKPIPASSQNCPYCGHERKAPSNVVNLDGSLRSYDDSSEVKLPLDDEREFCRQANWWIKNTPKKDGSPRSPGGVFYLWREKFKKADTEWPDFDAKRLSPREPTPEFYGWMKHRNIRKAKARDKAKEDVRQLSDYAPSTCYKHHDAPSLLVKKYNRTGGGYQLKYVCGACGNSLSGAIPHAIVPEASIMRTIHNE